MLYENPMTKEEYANYLASNEWKARRIRRLMMDRCTCQICGEDGENVHHISYKNLGNETMDDLVTLCKTCHWKQHRLINKINKKQYIQIDSKKYYTSGKIVPVGEILSAGEILGIEEMPPISPEEYCREEVLLDLFETFGDSAGKTLAFLMRNKDNRNEVKMTITEMAEEIGISSRSVSNSLELLEEVDLIVRCNKRKLMVNPYFIRSGGTEIYNVYLYNRYDKLCKEYGKGKYADKQEVEK